MPPGSWPGLPSDSAEDEVGEGGHRPGGPPHRHDRGFKGPVNLPQCFAVRAAALAVVSFSYVPAPVRVAGSTSPGAPTAPATTAAPGWRPGRPSRRSRPALRGCTPSPRLRAGLRPISPRLFAWLRPRPRSIFSAWPPALGRGSTLSFGSTEGSMTESTRWNR